MLDLTIIGFLQILIYFFGVVVLVLLSMVLFRVFKILWPVLEIIDIYKKAKNILSIYSNIPSVVKEKAKNIFKK